MAVASSVAVRWSISILRASSKRPTVGASGSSRFDNGNPMKRYLVLTLRTPRFDPAVIEAHYSHLEALQEQGALEAFGPFTDKSGGAYLVRAESLDEARAMAYSDPMHVSGSSKVIVYEWNAKECVPA